MYEQAPANMHRMRIRQWAATILPIVLVAGLVAGGAQLRASAPGSHEAGRPDRLPRTSRRVAHAQLHRQRQHQRHADISVNAGPKQRVLFPHTFHANNFWTLTVPVRLKAGHNTVRFSAEELPDFDGTTYISDRYPRTAALPLRPDHRPDRRHPVHRPIARTARPGPGSHRWTSPLCPGRPSPNFF